MTVSINQLSTEQLFKRLKNPAVKVVDIRPCDAYNGWKIQQEARGGHIKGAKSLPYKWLNYIDWIEIVRAKGMVADDELVIYGYNPEKVQKVAEQFHRAGFTQVYVYNNFVDQWCADDKLPMEKLEQYNKLVSAQWLHTLINTGTAAEYQNNRYIVCHAHYRNPGAYDQGHIPGAVEMDTNSLESPKTWNRRPADELKRAFESIGITHDTTVIMYGRFSFPDSNDPFPGSSAGHLGAIRCAFIMMYAGVKDVRVLNGGLQSWQDEGFEITTKQTPKNPVSDFGALIPAHPEFMVDMAQAKEMLKSDDSNLVSVRSWSEYIGQVSGYNYINKKGRIPGSVFANCGSDAYHMENYRNLDHTMREYHEIEKLWDASGITPGKHNAFYCGTGWRGSEAFFNAWLMGWPRISVFDGGWFEWSNDENNPIETGIPKNTETVQEEIAK